MEIVSSTPGKIMEKIVDELFNATVRQFGYLCKYEDNIQALSNELKKLADGRNDLQAEIDAAGKNGETIRDTVQNWIAEVEKIIAVAEKLLEDEVNANKRCLGGCCINLSTRYKFSKGAKAKTQEISALIGAGGSFGKDVSRPAPPPSIISFSEGFSAFKSRELIMKQTIEALKDENISIIGICGMGGVGKTTLVKEIQKQAKDLNMFDEVAMAVVSQTPSTTKIQDEIASWLGFKDLPGKDDPTRASSLSSRLQNAKRVLVILDDLWGRIELSGVGVPYGKDHKGCKILLTSRSRQVCHQMNAHQIFSVAVLTEQESWRLFREVVGPEVDNPEINPIAREVADKCGGLPIAILTVGRALKGMDQHVWKDANEQLKNSSPTIIEGVEEHVFSRVELSYNFLKSEEAKTIFLLCSCFPEDYRIPVEMLARYGMGLMCFQNIDSMEKARGRARSAVSNLIFSFLLIDGEEEGCVKMHDIVRSVAQQIASKKKFLIKAGVGLIDWPTRDTCKDLKVISLIDNDIQEIPYWLEMKCPNLRALLLQRNIGLKIPDNLFQGMKDLNVLDLSYTKLPSLPPSFSLLSNLRTLRLCHYKFSDDLSLIGELIQLEILDLSNSNITEIPVSFGQLICLRLLDLTGCVDLTIIPQGVISRLCKLEELYMLRSFNCWGWESKRDSRRNNARLIELHALSRLTSLHICIPGEVVVPPDMPSVNLTSFSIVIGYDTGYIRNELTFLKSSRALSLQPYWEGSVIPVWIKNLLIRSECLKLQNFKGVESLELINNVFNELKFLCISGCMDMKYLFKSLQRMPRVTFPKLEWLSINDNPTFLEIYHGQLPDGCFCNVKRLAVERCGNMLIILPSHLLKSIQNLEYFRALHCESVVYVFEFEGLEIELCSSFKELNLQNLPQMTHIWKGDPQFVSLHNLQEVILYKCPELGEALFPATLVQSLVHLEKLGVINCRKLEEIFGRKAAGDHEREWKRREHIHTNPSLALGNLVHVTISDCPKLRNLFTISMVKSLKQLQQLEVYCCPTLKEIFTATDDDEEEEVGASTKKIMFPCLLKILLEGLNSLSCFCSGLYNIEFPALDDLVIRGCPSMETFGYGQVMTPKLMHPWLDDKEYRWTGDLNDAIKHIFNQKNQEEDLSEISVADIN